MTYFDYVIFQMFQCVLTSLVKLFIVLPKKFFYILRYMQTYLILEAIQSLLKISRLF